MRVRAAYVPYVAAGIAGGALYLPVLTGLGRQWVEDTSTSHGILLVAAAALVLRRRLPALRAYTPSPALSGLAVVLSGLALYTLGSLGAELFVLRLSLPVVLFGVVLAIWGRPHARMLLGAFGLVLLAIPLPAVVVTTLTMPLQLVASQVAESLLAAGQIPVMRDGNLLVLNNATLEVAEACSGLRSATSLVSVAAVCAAILNLPWWRGGLMMLVALPVAIVGNGFRVAATGLLTEWIGVRATQGAIHDLTGYAAFAVMFAMVVAVLLATRPSRRAVPAAVQL